MDLDQEVSDLGDLGAVAQRAVGMYCRLPA
jgi:hypothetical protein